MAKTKIAGADVLLVIKDENDADLQVAGQQNTTLNLEAETMDVTDKTSGGWKTSMPGLKEWSIDQDVFYTLGDTSNKILLNAFLDGTTVDAVIRIGAKDDADGITFRGKVYVTSFPVDLAMDNAVSVSMTLAGASALEIVQGADPTP